MNRIAAVVVGLSLAFIGTSSVFATTHTVCSSGCDYTSIQDAISASDNGDIIAIEAGVYYEANLNPGGKAITIGSASGNLDVTIDAQQGGSVFVFQTGETSETVIKDLLITGGIGTLDGGYRYGGGIYCKNNSNPTITGCTISDNPASFGGGIACWYGSSPTITGCTIEGNTAYAGGGIYCAQASSNLTISGCTIEGNSSSELGGGIFCDDSNSPTITDCLISDNFSGLAGGGVYISTSSPTFSNCTLQSNSCNSSGGGIYCQFNAHATLDGCLISDNFSSQAGGGIGCHTNSNVNILNCTIEGNEADAGGGISCANSSNPNITGCTISNNTANSGGGISNYDSTSTSILSNTIVCGNVSDQIYGDWTNNGGNTVEDICPVFLGACCTGNAVVCRESSEIDCLYWGGQWLGEGTTCEDSPCPSDCLGDADGDGTVDVNDILIVIAQFGVTCP